MLVVLWACTAEEPTEPTESDAPPVVAVTFNSGTTESMGHSLGEISDAWYGDGLAWLPAVEATRAFLEDTRPDLVGFQEIFDPEACADIPPEHHDDFVCERWALGDPSVAEEVLGPDYDVRCHPGKPDKCLAVRSSFGTFRGDLQGGEVEGCGSGARVARGVVDRADGTELVVVNVHGSSGVSPEDQDCRTRQVDQVFVDLGDGEPAANGDANVILGDLNTDPGRWADFDPSAARWLDFVGDGRAFTWVTEVGPEAPRTYGGLATIDHVASDAFTGACEHPVVLEEPYFDHVPAVCALTAR